MAALHQSRCTASPSVHAAILPTGGLRASQPHGSALGRRGKGRARAGTAPSARPANPIARSTRTLPLDSAPVQQQPPPAPTGWRSARPGAPRRQADNALAARVRSSRSTGGSLQAPVFGK